VSVAPVAAGDDAIPSMDSILATLDEVEVPAEPKWKDSGRRSRIGALAAKPEEPRFGPLEGEQSSYSQATEVARGTTKTTENPVVRNTVMNAFAHTAFGKKSVKVFKEPAQQTPLKKSAASGEDASEQSERRLDPDTDRIFTWSEFSERYSGELIPSDMLAYWRQVCKPLPEVHEHSDSADVAEAHIEEAPGGGTVVAAESIDEILARLAADEKQEEKQEEEAEARAFESEREAELASSAAGRFALAALKRRSSS